MGDGTSLEMADGGSRIERGDFPLAIQNTNVLEAAVGPFGAGPEA